MAKAASKQQVQQFHVKGEFVRQTFIRLHKKEHVGSESEAVAAFNAAVSSGKIAYAREWNGVPYYQFQSPSK